MTKILCIIGFLFTACSTSTNLIDPISTQRKSVYIEPDDITKLAEGMVDNIIQSSKFSKITSYSFGKIENRSCEDEFETILISEKIKLLLHNKTSKTYSPTANYRFEGKLYQQCPFEDGKLTVTTTLVLQLINQSDNIPLWSHSISMLPKLQKSDWAFY